MIYLKIIITEKPREAKRISLSREPDQLTFNELCILVQRLFPKRVKGQTEFKLTFLDEDQESINIESDQDVTHALELHSKFQSLIPSLKIQVRISKEPPLVEEKSLELKYQQEAYEKELNSINQKMSSLFDKVTVIETHLADLLRMIKSSATDSNSADPNYITAQILKPTLPLSVESPSGSAKRSTLYSSSAPDSHNVPQFQSYNQPQSYQNQQYISHSTSSPASNLYGNTGGYASVVNGGIALPGVIQVNQSPSAQYFSSSQPIQPSLNSNGISPYNSHQVQQNQALPPPVRFR